MKYLKDRNYYEDYYDKETVEIGRREVGSLLQAREQFYNEAKITQQKDANVMEFWWERIYWWLVELPYLLPRWEDRDLAIDEKMQHDRLLDERIANARPHVEPTCTKCGKQGLRLKLKELLHRGSDGQEILFMFDCSACGTKSAFWEDGTEWVSPKIPCPRCQSSLEMTVKTRGMLMITTYSCGECDYKEVEKVHMNKSKEESPDTDYERDKKLYCLSDERAKLMQAYRPKWEEAMRMMDDDMKREANKEVYEAAAQITQLKIPELMEKLRTAIEKTGFSEVTFDKPELGYDVIVGFNCLDNDSSREDAKSRKALKKAVETTLVDTNWRMMSDGIDYRLGYLSGRLRAYEREEDLIRLVSNKKTKES